MSGALPWTPRPLKRPGEMFDDLRCSHGENQSGRHRATGYAGLEIVRLLLSHPFVEVAAVSSVSFEGQTISEIYPQLTGIFGETLTNDAAVVGRCDVVFGSLPAGLSEPIARRCFDAGKLYIDMGADFRLKNEAAYKQWYGKDYADPALHEAAVYCIPELHRARLAGAKLIGNPGCYPTSVALGLAPAVKAGAIDPATLVIDSKSARPARPRPRPQHPLHRVQRGVRALQGRRPPPHPRDRADPFRVRRAEVRVTFVPHLLAVNRGIVSTMYANFMPGFDLAAVRKLYEAFYLEEAFVKVLPDGAVANLKNVKYSNYCHISLHADAHTPAA